MDNKELIIRLNEVKRYIKHKDDIIAVEIAIKHVEAWNKVTDELEDYKIIGSQMECFGTTEENAKEYIPIDITLEIINKH